MPDEWKRLPVLGQVLREEGEDGAWEAADSSRDGQHCGGGQEAEGE